MRFQIPAAIVCDGCKRSGDGALQYTVLPGPNGAIFLPRVLIPDRWVAEIINPQILVTKPPEVDPFALNAMELSREAGIPVEAAFCGACKTKATSKRIVGEAIETAITPDTETVRAAEEERAKRDAEAEAAERAAFEAKRAQDEAAP